MRKKQISILDSKVLDLVNETNAAKEKLINEVKRVWICKNVIELYPDGADKIKALEDFKSRQKILLAAIGRYDCALRDLEEVEIKHKYEINVNIPLFSSSHDVIENTYYNLYKL